MKSSGGKKVTFDFPAFIISGSALLLFVIVAYFNADFVTNSVNYLFGLSATYFGVLYQFVLLGTFFIALFIGFSKFGKIRLGNLDKPEMSTFKWISIIMCTLLAGGGIFWAAAEPLSHFLSVPPHEQFAGIEDGSLAAIVPALATSFVDWGFLSWTVLGTLGTMVLMYAHYNKGMPLKPRSLLYPIFGEKIMKNSAFGTIVDVFAIISVAAGTIGPIGFLGLQASYGVSRLAGIEDSLTLSIGIIVLLVIAAAISAVTGIHKGIQILSSFNVILAIGLIVGILILGPAMFIFNNFFEALGLYVNEFVSLNTFRGDEAWLGGWTVFFFAWFVGYGPMMALFTSRISRGRTVRELVLAVAVIAPVVTTFWFTVVGGTDSMSLTISMAISGDGNPPKWLRAFYAVVMGGVAVVLVTLGEDSVGALQSFIVVTAVPVVLLLLTTFYTAPKAVRAMYKDQFGDK